MIHYHYDKVNKVTIKYKPEISIRNSLESFCKMLINIDIPATISLLYLKFEREKLIILALIPNHHSLESLSTANNSLARPNETQMPHSMWQSVAEPN